MLDQREVVRDHQVGEPVLRLNVGEQVEHLRANRDVERRDRFVEHQQSGLERERACDRDPLALAAAELVRKQPRRRRRQADHVEQFADAATDLDPPRSFVREDRLGQDGVHTQPGIERGVRILEDRLQLAAQATQARRRQRREIVTVESDRTGSRPLQPQHQFGNRRLAAARLADQREGFTLVDREAHTVDRLHVAPRAEQAAAGGEIPAQIAHFEQTHALASARPGGPGCQQATTWPGASSRSGG